MKGRKPATFNLFGTTWWDKFGIGIWLAQKCHTPQHVGCYFDMSDGSRVGFHAQHSVPGTELGGFVRFDFDAYAANFRTLSHRLRGKTLRNLRIPLGISAIDDKFDKCESLVGAVEGYAHSQILAKLAHELGGYPMPEDPEYIDCSEGMGMVLAHQTPWYDLRDEMNKNFDSLTPYEVWTGAKKRRKRT